MVADDNIISVGQQFCEEGAFADQDVGWLLRVTAILMALLFWSQSGALVSDPEDSATKFTLKIHQHLDGGCIQEP